MNKTLFSILALGAVGCTTSMQKDVEDPYDPYRFFNFRFNINYTLLDPYEPQKSETEEKGVQREYFVKDGGKTGDKLKEESIKDKQCLRTHYFGVKNNQLQSFTVSENCIDRSGIQLGVGNGYLVKVEDSNNDGNADKMCLYQGYTYLGRVNYVGLGCNRGERKIIGLLEAFNNLLTTETVTPLEELELVKNWGDRK